MAPLTRDLDWALAISWAVILSVAVAPTLGWWFCMVAMVSGLILGKILL